MSKKLTVDAEDEIQKLLFLRQIEAVDHHLDFMTYTWTNRSRPFVIGYHTRKICTCIDSAIEKFRKGISTYWVITIPFRHGKSEIISRKLPAHFLGLFPDCKVLLAGHTSELVEGFSKESRNLIDSPLYRELFPNLAVNAKDKSGSHWRLAGYQGECYATGLMGSMAGQGGDLLILDDYCRNRADAESETVRARMWTAFTDDFMTRRAETGIVIVLATRWHIDDIIGRIINEMKEKEEFPRFEVINIPAFSEEYPSGTLFPERFDKAWYEGHRATLGPYSTAALMQNDPVVRGGNMLNIDLINRHELDEFPNVVYHRVWDLAHTAKQRAKDDPDYTSGTLLAFTEDKGAYHLWVKDVCRMREEAPARDRKINQIADTDGPYVKIAVGGSVDSKDTISAMRNILGGRRTVISVSEKADKVVRATPLEAIFLAGNVHVPAKAPWLQAWLNEVAAFPKGAHDDQVDNLSAGFTLYTRKGGGVTSAPLYGV